jgi:hypothetical protein
MSEKELAVYRLIRAHYLAQFLPAPRVRPHCRRAVLRPAEAGGHRKQVVAKGWRLVLAEPQADEDGEATARSQVLPRAARGHGVPGGRGRDQGAQDDAAQALHAGRTGQVHEGGRQAGDDPRLKQKLKDTVGIGTEATRANIISGLIARGYIVKKGRSIRASDAAFTLIDAVPAAIADPGTTAVWEQALDMIEAGQLTLDVFLGKQAAWISQLIAQYGSTSLSIKVPQGPLARSAAHRRASAPARPAPSGRAVATPTAKARCRSNPARPSAAPRARAVAAAKAPDRPRSPWAVPCFKGVAHVPHALRDAQRATPSLVRVRVPLGRPRPRGLKVASPRTVSGVSRRILLVCMFLPPLRRVPRWLARLREPPGDPLWSAVFDAGAHRRKNWAPFVRGCAPDDAGANHDMAGCDCLMSRRF